MKHFYICFLVLILSCTTKEEYLTDYQKFINEIKVNWKSYSDNDWEAKEKEYHYYNVKHYEKFKRDLSPSEKTKIHCFSFAFNFYKGNISAKKLFAGEYNSIIKKKLKAIWDEIYRIGVTIFNTLNDIRTEGFVNIVNQLIQ
ncbi:DUF6565 domain-containing protein [Kordia sp.]|uniref:DUF6565 domain-containing protein n=1 Tax=Kordia sp. TaxID=1965332 RepID=UPI003D281292